MMTTDMILRVAAESIAANFDAPMASSARVAYDDAVDLASRHEGLAAARRALRAVAYCEGIFSRRYARIAEAIGAY